MITLHKNCLFPRENDLYPLSPFSTLEPPKSLERDPRGTRRVIRVIRGISINIYIFTIYILILFRVFSETSRGLSASAILSRFALEARA